MKFGALEQSSAAASAQTELLATKKPPVTNSLLSHSSDYPIIEASDDPRALLDESETHFYQVLKIALAQYDCQVLAKVHLPSLTKRADEALQPAAALNRALASLRCWEADFAICRGDSLVVVAVVRLRSNCGTSGEPERANLEEALDSTLAAASIPAVLVAEADRYDAGDIATLLQPHLTRS